MRTALLIFGDWHETIEIPEHINALYQERERLCGISVDKFSEKINSMPNDALLIDHPEIFDEEEEYYEDAEMDEILDGYFLQKAEELFGINKDEYFPEGYLPEGGEDIKIRFVTFSL
jgi:hypothetical protein